MHLVRLLRLSASRAVKIGINVEERIRDKVKIKMCVRAKIWVGDDQG